MGDDDRDGYSASCLCRWRVIEGRDVDELVAEAERAIGSGPVTSLPPVEDEPGLFADDVREEVAA